MLTIKILFTINSLKKLFRQNTIYNSVWLEKKTLNFDKKKIHLIKKIIRIKIISFQLKQSISIQKLFSRLNAFLLRKLLKKEIK